MRTEGKKGCFKILRAKKIMIHNKEDRHIKRQVQSAASHIKETLRRNEAKEPSPDGQQNGSDETGYRCHIYPTKIINSSAYLLY